jgi:ABC-2 type transport system permease protein
MRPIRRRSPITRVMGSLMLSLLGVMGAVWADKFDPMAAVT